MASLDGLIRCELDDMDVLVFELELPPPPLPELSAGEAEVAMLVGEGLSNAAIAHARGVSRRTVASQLRSIFRKLELGSRWALSLLLTRRALEAASLTNANRTIRAPGQYQPFGRTPPRRTWTKNPIESVLEAVATRTGGQLGNERSPDAALSHALAESDVVVRARTLIRLAMIADRAPRVAGIAAAVGVSVRTLQRQLRSEGVTFRRLLIDARLGEARRRLAGGEVASVVADALGYASASSLERALRL